MNYSQNFFKELIGITTLNTILQEMPYRGVIQIINKKCIEQTDIVKAIKVVSGAVLHALILRIQCVIEQKRV